jgi:hypothetical protein
MKPLRRFFQFTFGCRHGQRSRVFTIKERTYQVCLECGQELDYSWAQMHPLQSRVAGNPYASL